MRNRNFANLWCAESISQLGSQVSLLALPLVAISVLHVSTFAVGALTAVEFSPLNASMRFMVWGTMPFGSLAGGALGAAIGLRPTLIVAGIGGLAAVPWAFVRPVRTLREIPRAAPSGAD